MSEYRRLFLFGEGDDDERFLQEVVRPRLKELYDDVQVVQYAQLSSKKRSDWLRSIKGQDAEYLVFTDLDTDPCITKCKKKLKKKWGKHSTLDFGKIVVVAQEIEGWYLAGIDEQTGQRLRIQLQKNTNTLTKEDFHKLRPKKKFRSERAYMGELLEHFSINTAKKNNVSFKYFMKKHKIPAA